MVEEQAMVNIPVVVAVEAVSAKIYFTLRLEHCSRSQLARADRSVCLGARVALGICFPLLAEALLKTLEQQLDRGLGGLEVAVQPHSA